MKKIIYFLIVVIVIVIVVAMAYINYKATWNNIKEDNFTFEYYNQKEILGTEVATLINKAVDNNIKFNVSKDENGKYIENNENSINIQIYILDNETTYDMETIYSGGIDKFVQNFGSIKFKCTNLEYHDITKRVKKVYFEQVQD